MIEYTNFVRPICLPKINQILPRNGTVVGWGWTGFGIKSKTLQKFNIAATSRTECLKNNLEELIDDGRYCGGKVGLRNTCNGDYGGGVFLEENSIWIIAGIVSLSRVPTSTYNYGSLSRCDESNVLFYTNVAYYIDWINKFL
jgi:secreted trypsin-like serine protease